MTQIPVYGTRPDRERAEKKFAQTYPTGHSLLPGYFRRTGKYSRREYYDSIWVVQRDSDGALIAGIRQRRDGKLEWMPGMEWWCSYLSIAQQELTGKEQ